MASFNKFNSFVEAMAEKVHNLGSDQLKIALTAAAAFAGPPSVAHASGTYKLVCVDLVLTASGGSVGPFRYIVFYNDTATNKELIGFWDYGSDVTLANGETFTIDFDGTNGVLQVA